MTYSFENKVLSVSFLHIICQFIYPFETRHKINIDPFQAPLTVIIDPLFDMKFRVAMCFCKVINCMQIKFKNLSVLYMVSFLFFKQELVKTYFHREIDKNKYVYINMYSLYLPASTFRIFFRAAYVFWDHPCRIIPCFGITPVV